MPAEKIYKLDNGKELVCLEVMRSLPGKRLVFMGEYEGGRIVAKLYLDAKKAEKHWRRELTGLDVFQQCDIPTADLLYAGKTVPEGNPIIVLVQLAGLQSVRQVWDNSDDKFREQVLNRMTLLLVRHHQAGMCQTDLHLDNFMLSDKEIFSLDGAGVQFYANGVSKENGLQNLALFIAQLKPEWESKVSDIYALYFSAMGWKHGPGPGSLLDMVREAREGRWTEFRNKLFRNCTAFNYTRHVDGFQVVSTKYASRELLELLRNPDATFPGKERALKNGNTCTVWAAAANDMDLVIKRYNIKGLLHGIKLRLFSGRGERSWVNGHRLSFYGVPTPTPIALLKRRSGPFPVTYLLTERVQAISAREWFCDPNISSDEKSGMAEQIAKVLQTLQQQRINHGDLKASNILIADSGPMIIDLDAMCRHRSATGFKRAWDRDMQRFLKNWEDDRGLLGIFIKSLKSSGIDVAGAI